MLYPDVNEFYDLTTVRSMVEWYDEHGDVLIGSYPAKSEFLKRLIDLIKAESETKKARQKARVKYSERRARVIKNRRIKRAKYRRQS